MRGSVTGNRPRVFVEIGQRFGRLVVTSTDAKVGVTPRKPAGWRAAVCLCDCGSVTTVQLHRLVRGTTKSCGCLKKRATHGLCRRGNGHPLYHTHWSMMARCYREDDPHYPWWGGRGIKVCDRWHDVLTFIKDIEASIGPRPEGRYPLTGMHRYTLDRIDNDGDYEPGNVRWATASQQQANTRQTSKPG